MWERGFDQVNLFYSYESKRKKKRCEVWKEKYYYLASQNGVCGLIVSASSRSLLKIHNLQPGLLN